MSAACASTPHEPTKDVEVEAEAEDAPAPHSADNSSISRSRPVQPDTPPPGVKIKGNVPVRTESELEAEASARDNCVRECVASRQMQAKAADAIEADCNNSCQQQHPIVQVEVVPDSPIE